MMACHARLRPSVYEVLGRWWDATWGLPTVCAIQCLWWHATLNIIQLSVLSKGYDGMPGLASSNRVCCPRAAQACHARLCSIVCVVQRRWWHATPYIIQPWVLSNGNNKMRRGTSVISVCSTRAMMECHDQCRPKLCVVEWLWWHAMPEFVRLCELSKGYYGMPRPSLFHSLCYPLATRSCHTWRRQTVCVVQGPWWHATLNVLQPCVVYKHYDGMLLLTLSNCVWCPRDMISILAWCHPSVCVIQGLWWYGMPNIVRVCAVQGQWLHVTPDVIWPCVLSKVYEGMPRPTLFIRMCSIRAMMAC